MPTQSEQKTESSLPRSVRLSPETETRLKAMLDANVLSFPQVLDFAVSHLLTEIDQGKEIRFAGKKLQLVDSGRVAATQPGTEESSQQIDPGDVAKVEAKISPKHAPKRARA